MCELPVITIKNPTEEIVLFFKELKKYPITGKVISDKELIEGGFVYIFPDVDTK